ncbi:Serine/threonine protein kinase involved in cell cycle control [Trachipleistophora hominis]|uniref:non-specific serine/threonine protein kinase n=1 Tax=Trachipleistophora hominis TaxID=72359 RepID=L7JTV7_TRAHO|nr:Serine/threonine protein kinase involved in cell cycle control [Trachipleistophora hominis]
MDEPFVKPVKTYKDKSDRATRDKVLDRKTLVILEKLQKRNILFDLEGCISSGKEANIYRAKIRCMPKCKFIRRSDSTENFHDKAGDTQNNNSELPVAAEDVVIKIFRTSILEFKNRNVYITNEIRFKNFRISNPRKLIKTWAEKEVRNLTRLNNSGIPSPQPLYLKRNIIIMRLIGDDVHVAAKLKDLQNVHFYPKFITRS